MTRSRLGPLAIESKLGDHPSRSNVWRAVHVQLKKAVAVRIFPTTFGGTPEARASFAAEWGKLKAIQHPAIARCYGGGFEGGEAYLAHELIEGETLALQLERRTRLSWESVLDMAEPLIDALEYLHQNNIVHGRIGPEKIIFAGLSPVLLDVRIDRATTPFRTKAPPTVQEINMQPPEWIDDPTDFSIQSDLYCIGATLYLAITGQPPFQGSSVEEASEQVKNHLPISPAAKVLECPVWFDKLIMHLMQKDPAARPPSATAVKLALGEVRRRSMSRAGVAEHVSSGFSPLNVTDQKDRDVARQLLGKGDLSFEEEEEDEPKHANPVAWHDRPWVLLVGLGIVATLFAFWLWPLDEDQMRKRAEDLLSQDTRQAINQAKVHYLQPMLTKFPEGKHNSWALEQIDRVEMRQAEFALEVKLKRNLPLKNEAERLYAEASRYERFGDITTAMDRYRSMQTLFGDDPQYRPFVNLARRQLARIGSEEVEDGEASRIIETKLEEAEELMRAGKVVGARQIWYSVVELYGENDNVAPLVSQAQARLSKDGSP